MTAGNPALLAVVSLLIAASPSPSASTSVPQLHRTRVLLAQRYWGTAPFAVSRDGRLLAISERHAIEVPNAANDGWHSVGQDLVVIRDVRTGARLRALPHGAAAMAFSPDGSSLAIASRDLTVYDTSDWGVLWSVRGVALDAVVYSPDGKSLAVGGYKPLIASYDVRTGRERWQQTAGSVVTAIAVDPSGTYVASASDGGGLRLWKNADGVAVRTFGRLSAAHRTVLAHSARTLSVAFRDAATLVSGAGDGTAKWWSVTSGAMLHTIDCVDFVASIAVRADGALAVGCNASGPVVYAPHSYARTRDLSDGALGTKEVAAAPTGWWVAGGQDALTFYADGSAHGATVSGVVRAVEFSADRRWFAYALGDGDVHLRRAGAAGDYAVLHGLPTGAQKTQMMFGTHTALAVDAGSRTVAGATYTTDGGPDHIGAYDPYLTVWRFDGKVVSKRTDVLAQTLAFAGNGRYLVAKSPNMEDSGKNFTVVDFERRPPVRFSFDIPSPFDYASSTISAGIVPSVAAISSKTGGALVAMPSGSVIRSYRNPPWLPALVLLSPNRTAMVYFGDRIAVAGDDWLRESAADLGGGSPTQVDSDAGYDVGNDVFGLCQLDRTYGKFDEYRFELRSVRSGELSAKGTSRDEARPMGGFSDDFYGIRVANEGSSLYLASPSGVSEWRL